METRANIPSILVVDDEPAIAELVCETLRVAGMRAASCPDGARALDALSREPFDLVMLDVMMPGMDGFELCARIRAVSRVPVIFLSAKDEEPDKVFGLMTGADDYITKPFMPRELVARVRSCLRRGAYAREGVPEGGDAAPDLLMCRGLELRVSAHVALLHGERLSLTPKEFQVLAVLLRAGGRPVPTRELYEAAWRERYMDSNANSVMVHVRHLRTKLAAIDADQTFIETVWGVGYKIAP